MDAGIVVVAFLIVAQVVTTLDGMIKDHKIDALNIQANTLAKHIKYLEGIIKHADAIVEEHRLAARADQVAVPESTEGNYPDLVEEINRLRAENAVLSGAYQFVLLEEDGRRRMVSFDLN